MDEHATGYISVIDVIRCLSVFYSWGGIGCLLVGSVASVLNFDAISQTRTTYSQLSVVYKAHFW